MMLGGVTHFLSEKTLKKTTKIVIKVELVLAIIIEKS